jgi:hypothetical protein
MTTANDTQIWEIDLQIIREDVEDGRVHLTSSGWLSGQTYTCTYDLDCDAKAIPVRKHGEAYWGGHALCEDHAALERFAL